MATAVKQPARPPPRSTKRPQLPPSDDAPPRHPKPREVTSRYLSPSTSSKSSSTTSTTLSSISSGSSISSRRSPMIGTRAAITPLKTPQRAVSADRRRPVAETPSSAGKLLVRSVRNQSVSFHGESYSVPVSKAKPPPAGPRKALATPAIGRRENLLPSDQKQNRWPGRLHADNSSLLTRSLDCGNRTGKLSRSGLDINDLRRSIVDEGSNSISKVFRESNPKNGNEETHGIIKQTGIQRSRVSPLSNRTLGPSKLPSPQSLCSPRALSPAQVGGRAASPTGVLLRGITSPSRARSAFPEASVNGKNSTTPSMLSSKVDVSRGKLGENKVPDAHDLKLLHNRLLQWRLVNAMEDDAMLVQQRASERSLYNAWLSTSKLRQSVTSKRLELQLLRQNLNLYSILKKHESHLERWGELERGHYISVSNVIKALESITLRLPVAFGAKADLTKVQEAITSAVDVMQGMGTSVCSLLIKVEQMSALMSELSKLVLREHQLLNECKDTISQTVIPLQVIECSLRTHILQALEETSVKRV